MPIVETGNTLPRIKYVGDSVCKTFYFNFQIFEAEDIEIYLNDTKQTSGFCVEITPNNIGGNVIFNDAPKLNAIITINRNLEIKRKTDFGESKAFRAKTLNFEFDYLVACLKQLSDNIKRTLELPVDSDSNVDLQLPIPNPGKALVWDESGSKLKNSDINIEDLDIYAQTALEAAEAVVIATQAAAQISELTDTINQAHLLATNANNNKLNKTCNDITDAGKNALRTFLASIPTTSNTVGKITPIVLDASKIIAPSGGTWFYYYLGFTVGGALYWNTTFKPSSGVCAGGTTLANGVAPGYTTGFFWRIA